MEKYSRNFRSLLRSYDIGNLRAHTGAIYGLWADFRLAYLSPGWFRFAEANGGEPRISTEWGLRRSVLECIPPSLGQFYEGHYRRCMKLGEVWSHEYECSSDSIYRRYHQIVYPLNRGKGLLVVNSLVIERPHDPVERPPQQPTGSRYVDHNGLICQCAHCRRVQNLHDPSRWDWVPDWVKNFPEGTSHSLCPTCFGYYYSSRTSS